MTSWIFGCQLQGGNSLRGRSPWSGSQQDRPCGPLGVAVPTIGKPVVHSRSYFKNFGERLIQSPQIWCGDSGLSFPPMTRRRQLSQEVLPCPHLQSLVSGSRRSEIPCEPAAAGTLAAGSCLCAHFFHFTFGLFPCLFVLFRIFQQPCGCAERWRSAHHTWNHCYITGSVLISCINPP